MTTFDELAGYTSERLLQLFRSGAAEGLPDGRADGILLLLPGTVLSRGIAAFTRRLVWQGKTFDRAAGRLSNRVLPTGAQAVPARVYIGPSRLDARPCVVIQYAGHSWLAWPIRDEIREIEAGLWLGLVWCGRWRVGMFGLRF